MIDGPRAQTRGSRLRVLATVQPVYLPWIGYFEQIAMADVFALVDHVKFSRYNWRNCNRIYGPNGTMWLTVPIRHERQIMRISAVDTVSPTRWQQKHLRSTEGSHRKCAYCQPLFNDLVQILESPHRKLSQLNEQLIRLLCRYLDIKTEITRNSEVTWVVPEDDKTGRVIEFCKHYQAGVIYAGPKAAAYLDVYRVSQSGTKVVFQNYDDPTYRQRFSPFVSHLSAIDLIFNTGDAEPAILRSSPFPADLRERS